MPRREASKVIGERLRVLRKSEGLSQEELAHLSNLHPTYIGQLERGEKNPTIDTIQKVANALEISLEELFRFNDKTSELQSETIIQLTNLLHKISDDDRETILKIIHVMLDWKNKTKE